MIRVQSKISRPAPMGRRLFLGGAGVALGLPLLESLLGRQAKAEDTTPRRMLAFYVPDGIHMAGFRPTIEGANYDLPPILAPLGAIASKVSVLSGLRNDPARPDGPGDHASGTGAFLTVAHPKKTQGADIQNGISMDQVAANAIGALTRIPSLQLGIDSGSGIGDCDSGYSCAYARNISWASATEPLPKLTSPALVFDQLFGGFDPEATAEQQARRRARRESVLDYVREDAKRLQGKLGATDRQKLDQFLTGVGELEVKIGKEAVGPACDPIDRPSDPVDLDAHVEIMSDLMALAFQCDATRIITFMLANAGSNRSYEFLGVSGGHHEISHHQGLADNFARLTTINAWEVAKFASLLTKLDALVDVDGKTLLDNSLVFFSSEISDGNAHNHDDMPVLLAGSGGGTIVPGRHVVFPSTPSVAELFLSMLAACRVEVAAFGDATSPLGGL